MCPKTGGRAFVVSKSCTRIKLRRDLKNAPWVCQKRAGRQGAENKHQTYGYRVKVSADTEMRLWICEGTHGVVRRVSQNPVKKLGRVSVVRLVKVPSYCVIVEAGETFLAGLALSDGSMEDTSVVDPLRYHVLLARKSCTLPDAFGSLPESELKSLTPLSAEYRVETPVCAEEA